MTSSRHAKRLAAPILACLLAVIAAPAARAFDVVPVGCANQLAPDFGYAVFGYESPNAATTYVDYGNENIVLQSPNFREGQPTAFLPGRHEGAFLTPYQPNDPDGNDVTWFLQGAVVSVADRPCGGEGRPRNVVPPALSGTPAVGATATLDPGTWEQYGGVIMRWVLEGCDGVRCVALTPRLDAASTVLPSSAAGLSVRARVLVVGARGLGIAVSPLSAPVPGSAPPIAAPGAADLTSLLRFTAQPASPDAAPAAGRAGEPLTADTTWIGKPAPTTTVAWQRCAATCTDIAGATGQTFVPTDADVGTSVRAVVTGTGERDIAKVPSGPARTIAASGPTRVLERAPAVPAERPSQPDVPVPSSPPLPQPGQAPVVDRTAPLLRGVGLTRTRFRVAASSVPLAARVGRGTVLRLRTSEPAFIRVDVRNAGGRTVATLTRLVGDGASRIALSGRFRDGRRTTTLKPGRYRVAVQAIDAAGNRSRTAGAAFSVVR